MRSRTHTRSVSRWFRYCSRAALFLSLLLKNHRNQLGSVALVAIAVENAKCDINNYGAARAAERVER